MAIGTQFPLDINSLDPELQFKQTKNNFAKGQKQKTAAQCCRSAKFGSAPLKPSKAEPLQPYFWSNLSKTLDSS